MLEKVFPSKALTSFKLYNKKNANASNAEPNRSANA